MTNPLPQTDDTDRQLVLLSEQSNALAAPGAAVEAIGAQLDALFAAGAPGDTLDTIQANALALADTVTQHHAALKTSLELAKRIQQQRQTTLTALEDLKNAIRLVDTSVPEIETLYNDVEEILMEWHAVTWYDEVWEYVEEMITEHTGLDDTAACRLIDLLSGDGPNPDSSIWFDLNDWIDRAQIEAKESEGPLED